MPNEPKKRKSLVAKTHPDESTFSAVCVCTCICYLRDKLATTRQLVSDFVSLRQSIAQCRFLREVRISRL